MCVARPAQTEGPFFVEEALERSDIRTDTGTGRSADGTPLRLEFAVGVLLEARCSPLAGAKIDVWHCDAAGHYSDVDNFGVSTAGRKFLRGYQTTDASGTASFVTIYPGAYPGRAVHLHLKLRTATPDGRTRVFTSQLYFDDGLTDRVHAAAPYAGTYRRRTRNADDALYRHGGAQLTLAPSLSADGAAARFLLGVAIG